MAFKVPKRRMLLIKTRAIGDTVLLTGVLRLLHEKMPNYVFDVLVKLPGGDLLEGLDYIDRIICIKEPHGKLAKFAYWMRLSRRLRDHKYEYVLNFHSSMRTAAFTRMLRADKVVCNHHDLDSPNWFSDLKVPNRGVVKPIIDRDLDVLRAIGIEATLDECMPELKLTPIEVKKADERILKVSPQKGMKIFIGMGASRETKRWQPHHTATLISKIIKDFDAHFYIGATSDDKHWLEMFYVQLKKYPEAANRVHVFSHLSLRDAAALISRCQMYIGNDSGMKHIAAAFGLTTFTFFGPEQPIEWHPYDVIKHPYAFVPRLECRTNQGKHWCSIRKCNEHTRFKHQCMEMLTPDSVYPAILQKLTEIQESSL